MNVLFSHQGRKEDIVDALRIEQAKAGTPDAYIAIHKAIADHIELEARAGSQMMVAFSITVSFNK